MRTYLILSVLVLGFFLPTGDLRAAVLFSDSFDRADNTDIDALSGGMSGSLAPLAYQESFEGSGQPSSIQLLSGRLQMAVGVGMSNVFPDHNFTGAELVAAGGFSVSLEIVEINSAATDPANRFAGFGVGMTRAEALAAGDMNDSATTFRGGGAAAGVCDFFVDLALDGALRLWSRGTLLKTVAVGTTAGTLKGVFSFSTFNAGAAVNAVVYFNGVQRDSLTFTWSDANANYLGLSGRASAFVSCDTLAIETLVQLPGAIVVSETGGRTMVQEGGYSDTIDISLTSSPLAYPVTIDVLDTLNPAQVTVSPSQVQFTAENWQSPQTITITAIDDHDMERAMHETALRFGVTTAPESPYSGVSAAEITVQIADNDCGAWGFNPADFNLDCQVNLEDFYYFVQEWISCSLPDPQCQDFRY